jgi:hypothetical protein
MPAGRRHCRTGNISHSAHLLTRYRLNRWKMIDIKAFVRIESGYISPAQSQSAWARRDRNWSQQNYLKAMGAILIAIAGLAIAGCAAGGAGDAGYSSPAGATAPAATSAAPSASGVKAGGEVGVWEGLSLASCGTFSAPNRCNAQEKITLTLLQGEKGLTGYYQCAYATMDCLGQNQTGKIVDAKLDGGQLWTRVQMPDGTSCLYTGRTAGNRINGGYSCYGGGALIESGSWQGERTY